MNASAQRAISNALLIAAFFIVLCVALGGSRGKTRSRIQIQMAAYDPASEYYAYLEGLFMQAIANHYQETRGQALPSTGFHIQPCDALLCSSPAHTIAVNCEHTLVATGGHGLESTPSDEVLYDGKGYRTRLLGADGIPSCSCALVDYSRANIEHVRRSGLYPQVSQQHYYIAPSIFGDGLLVPSATETRNLPLLTTFVSPDIPRRARLLERLPAGHTNRADVWGAAALHDLYLQTRILINVHQTDYHRTLEELRILPALQCGVIVVSEPVPLASEVPYHSCIVFEELDGIPELVSEILADYPKWHARLFDRRNMQKLRSLHAENQSTAASIVARLLTP